MWFSVINQQESAIGTPLSPPSQSSLSSPSHLPPHPALQPFVEPLFEFPEAYSKFPLAICFTHGIINFYVTLSIHLPSPSSPPTLFISSVGQSCLTLCDPMDYSMPGLPVHHQLPELTQTHVH